MVIQFENFLQFVNEKIKILNVYQIVKYYMYSLKKNLAFKIVFLTYKT